MKRIYEWALMHLDMPSSVVDAIGMLKVEQAERFVEVAVQCAINKEDVPQEIIYNDKVHKLVRCNYILDEITYTCEDSSTRYFTTQEAADKYAENGDYPWNESSSNPKDEYPFKGVWTRECEHTTWYSRWFEWANKPM